MHKSILFLSLILLLPGTAGFAEDDHKNYSPRDGCSEGDKEKAKVARKVNDEGMKLYKSGQWLSAFELFAQAYMLDCKYFLAVTNAASSLAKSGADHEAAVEWLELAYPLNPEGALKKLKSDPDYAPLHLEASIHEDSDLGKAYAKAIAKDCERWETFKSEAQGFQIGYPACYVGAISTAAATALDKDPLLTLTRRYPLRRTVGGIGEDEFTEFQLRVWNERTYERPKLKDYEEPGRDVRISFSPTKVGNNPASLLSYTQGGPEETRTYYWIYEFKKDGKIYAISFHVTQPGSNMPALRKQYEAIVKTFAFLEPQ